MMQSNAADPLSHQHPGTINDIRWSQGDTYLACAGGDGATSIHATHTGQLTAIVEGHVGAVKSLEWSKPNPGILYTGGRDGDIVMWDLRCKGGGREVGRLTEKIPKPSTRSKKRDMRYGPRSVTAIVQRDGGQRELISASAADGYVDIQVWINSLTMIQNSKLRKWDVRMASGNWFDSNRNKANVGQSEEDPTISSSAGRPRGITSIVRGSGRTKGMIFGLAFDSRLHVYEDSELAVMHRDYGGNGTHKTMRCLSYCIKLGIHMSGEQIVSGGQDGAAFIWNTSGLGVAGVVAKENKKRPKMSKLAGHNGEVGAVDFAWDSLAACGIDGTVRIWRGTKE